MDIDKRYAEIGKKFQHCLERGSVDIDDRILRPDEDFRRGLSLIFRPTAAIVERLNELYRKLDIRNQRQYIQPKCDLHSTVLSVIPATSKFSKYSTRMDHYVNAVERSVDKFGSCFSVSYQGVLASNDSVIVKGYPDDRYLQDLRTNIISELSRVGPDSHIMQRYDMVTAHMTIIRFVAQFDRLEELRERIAELKNIDIGNFLVEELALVESDWYMRQRSLKSVRHFVLSQPDSRDPMM